MLLRLIHSDGCLSTVIVQQTTRTRTRTLEHVTCTPFYRCVADYRALSLLCPLRKWYIISAIAGSQNNVLEPWSRF